MSTYGISKFATSLSMIVLITAAGLSASVTAHADNLLINRVQQEDSLNLPPRGMSMAEVEKTFGAPQRKLAPRGGTNSKQPTINSWVYADYIVYFENEHVIHAVLNTPAGNNTNPADAK